MRLTVPVATAANIPSPPGRTWLSEQRGIVAEGNPGSSFFPHCRMRRAPLRLPLFAGCLLFLSFVAAKAEDGGQSRQVRPTTTLSTILVVGDRESASTEETGYKPGIVRATGPWGARSIQDTPYSITVLPATLIENSTARNLDQLFTMTPLVQTGQSQDINSIAQATLRGFNVARAYVNGIQNNNLGMGVFVEEIEQLEIINGLSGFLYGASPVGGVINYQLKRSTVDDLRALTIGNYGGGQRFAHADLGGRVGADRRFGYRLNLLAQNGDTPIDDQKLRRGMASGSIDWWLADDTRLELFLSRKNYRLDGRQFQFYLDGNVPAPLDGGRLYAPGGTYVDVESDEANLAFTHRLSGNWGIRSAYQRKKDTRSMVYSLGELLADESQFRFNLYGGRNAAATQGGYFYVDGSFVTGPVSHRLTIGINGYNYVNSLAILSNGLPSFFSEPYTYAFSDRSVIGLRIPDWNLNDSRWMTNARSRNINAVVGDEITFNRQWSMLAGANRSTIRSESFDFTTGQSIPGTRYEKSKTTPTFSILYKPDGVWTTYLSYMESLEQGSIVGPTYANANQVLGPLTSRQYELGAKAGLDKLFLAAALFQIDRAYERPDDGTPTGTYVQDGLQVHRGLELSVTGRPLRQLSVMAGLTLMDNEVRRSADPALNGKEPNWVADKTFKVYTEYAPVALPGWTFTAGLYYKGDGFQDPLNTRKLPGHTLVDLGLRYRTQLFGRETTARLNLMNVGDKRYWAATSPGTPRTVAFTLSSRF